MSKQWVQISPTQAKIVEYFPNNFTRLILNFFIALLVSLILMIPIGLGVYLILTLLSADIWAIPVLVMTFFSILGWFFGNFYLSDAVKEEFLLDRGNGTISHTVFTRIKQLFRLRTPDKIMPLSNFNSIAILRYLSSEIEPESDSDDPYNRYCLEMIAKHPDENLVIECVYEDQLTDLEDLGQKLANFLHLPFQQEFVQDGGD